MLTSFIVAVVRLCLRHRWVVVIASVALMALGVRHVINHFAINTDSGKLISESVPWRQLEIAFDVTFPSRTGLTVVVIDALTPEAAENAANLLNERLGQLPEVIRSSRRPDGGDFFKRNGLLFLSTAEVKSTTEQLFRAQAFLGTLAADPSLRGVMDTLSLAARGVREKETTIDSLDKPLSSIAGGFEAALAGKPPAFSWRELFTGTDARERDKRRILLVQPVLDYTALEPGQIASEAIREAAHSLKLDEQNGIRVRLTGPVPLADEEFATVADGAALNAAITVLAVVFILWLALKSPRIMFAVFASLVVGLAATAALGLMMVGSLNLISVAFAVLFVGLGVDFGIQFSVRYRDERHRNDNIDAALCDAAGESGRPLLLAAVSTAMGFFSFLPTEYRGLSELGLIAGVGMLLAFATSITLLPALISLLRPRGETEAMGYAILAPVDHFLARHRRAVLIATAIISIGGLPLLAFLRFDFNPLNLRSPKVESVSTFLDLSRDPLTSPNVIDILSPTLDDANALSVRLETLPEVDHVLTLSDFVPSGQKEKLELIEDAAALVGPTLAPGETRPAPGDDELIISLQRTAADLSALAKASPGKDQTIARLAEALEKLAQAAPAVRARAKAAFVPPLLVTLDQLQAALQASAVTRADLPPDLVADWIAADGSARLEVAPKGDGNDNAVLRRFADAVRQIAPNATGVPVSIQESGKTVVNAFLHAGAFALITILILLWVVLRRLSDVLLTLIPLILAGVVTLELCVVFGLPLNFANIIALPLLLGVGVAFKIYFVMAWRAGVTDLLQSSLTRAVFYSAMTTAVAFGSLWLSNHPGTSSMGQLLALSLVTTLAAAVLFQPVLMGPPRVIKQVREG
ncbi:MMPL family transporter [Candidatus Raskinella chloraquaticus]|uniref:Hopanoid biosynthesis-associated RND transporter HpnN n=1 Tax=Candidatus Raskinella chloraquaticus TaxID=1951219 RepID=A0A1W9HS02_9HYPH|nr:MAG: hopanoid biosynthesis-associated RND transporter HpnN [Proteobacteria bacterium SG_bin8]